MEKFKSFKLVRASEPLPIRPLVTVLYGPEGIGKTTLSFTMPRPLHLDFDKGIMRAMARLRPDGFQLDSFGEFHDWVISPEFQNFIKEEDFKSVIIDTVGTLLDNFGAPYLLSLNPKNGNGGGGLGLTGWGNLKTMFNRILERCKELGLEICLICHDKREGEEHDSKMGLSVSGGSNDIIRRSADMIGYIHFNNKVRTISFNGFGRVGKNTAGLPDTIIPHGDKPEFDTFLLDHVINPCKEKMGAASAAALEFNKQLDVYKKDLSEAKTVGNMEAIRVCMEEETILMKTQLRQLFLDRLKELGMIYDKETKSVKKAPKKKATPKEEVQKETTDG